MTSRSALLSYEDLYPYQLRMIEHIRENDCCALWVDMGLGKTVTTLTALQHLIEDFESRKVLVVAPLRVARKTWTDEIQEWSHLHGLRAAKIIGSSPKARLAGLSRGMQEDADIFLINRENMEWLSLQFMEHRNRRWYKTAEWPWDTVVLDESQSFRNMDSNRYRAFRRCRKWVQRLIQLSGTPAPNGLENLWAQAYLLDQGQRLGTTKSAFRKRWMNPPDYLGAKWTFKPNAETEIHRLMGDIALSMKAEDYLDLPPVVDNYVRVEMTPKEFAKYKEFRRTAVMELSGETITAANAGVLWGKLLQLANGAVYTEHPAWEPFHEQKVEAFIDLLDGIAGPAMIAYNYKSDLARIEAAMRKEGINYRVLKTESDEDDWNDGKIHRLLLHPASAGHGLNLQKAGARDLIWFGENADLELYTQCNARLIGGHRRGGETTIHHIVCENTLDDDVMLARREKANVQERLMQATKKLVSEL